mgnify:CR=1 FL=1|tara:strand:+ start:14234 stop:15973 length:1740 start_codon:yes stop_codon:yes gene_type:complete
MKKFNGHRCERRNLTDLVLGTGPDGKKRPKPKAKKRPKNFTIEPARNKKYLGGNPTGDPLPESNPAIPMELQNDPMYIRQQMLAMQAQNLRNRFTNARGEFMKEYDPRVAGFIDNELLGGRFKNKQTDYNYKYLPEGMPDEPENYRFIPRFMEDVVLPENAEKNRLGTAWSAGTVTNLAQAYDPSFEGSTRHSDYINRALQGEGSYEASPARRGSDYQIGDILFRGRGKKTGNKKFGFFKRQAKEGQSYDSHSDIITDITMDADGNPVYSVMGGNMSDTLYDRELSAKDLARKYRGRMTNTNIANQSAAYNLETNPLLFGAYPANETMQMLQRYGGRNVPKYSEGGQIFQDLTGVELMNQIQEQNKINANRAALGAGLGTAGSLLRSLSQNPDSRPTDAFSLADGFGGVLEGAGMGAQFGLPGAIIGGAFGLGKSLLNHHREKNQYLQALEEAKAERTAANQDSAKNFSTQVLSTYDQNGIGAGYYEHGGSVDYETEKSEVILAGPNDPPIAIGQGTYKRKSNNLYEGAGPSHEMGGIPTRGATEPFVDQMGQVQDSPYVFSDAKEMRFDPSSILSMIS